jgi:hypothetical protein
MTQAPFKFCPSCGQKLVLHMTHCGRCYAAQPTTSGPFRPVTPQTDAPTFTMPANQPASGYVPFTPSTPSTAPAPPSTPTTNIFTPPPINVIPVGPAALPARKLHPAALVGIVLVSVCCGLYILNTITGWYIAGRVYANMETAKQEQADAQQEAEKRRKTITEQNWRDRAEILHRAGVPNDGATGAF